MHSRWTQLFYPASITLANDENLYIIMSDDRWKGGQHFYADIICLPGVQLQGSGGMIELKSSTLTFDPAYFIHRGQAVPLFSVHISNSERERSNRLDLVHIDIFYYSSLPLCMCVCARETQQQREACMLREALPERGREEEDKKKAQGSWEVSEQDRKGDRETEYGLLTSHFTHQPTERR